jgi:transposase
MENIAFDSHKRYTLCIVEDQRGNVLREERINHERGAIHEFLSDYEPGSYVALETIGNWYWIVDEIEAAGMNPLLVHARKAKLMLGNLNKTDRLDARGLNRLQRTGTLPMVWIPSGDLRDKRDLPRSRMFLVNQRTCLKNRISSTLSKYALEIRGVSDIFGKRSRDCLKQRIKALPPNCQYVTERQLSQIESLDTIVSEIDNRMEEVFDETEEVKLLRTLPGIGFIFGIVISLEVGDISRFRSPQSLASYSGTTPRVHASGGRTRYGTLRPDVNRYLKWSFCEAANTVSINSKYWPEKYVTKIYWRIRNRKGHAKAVGAVARHLAESTFWILKKREPYRDPGLKHNKPIEA